MLKIPPKRSGAGQRGTALIEFALVLPMLIVLTFLVVDFGRALRVENLFGQASREGECRRVVGRSAAAAISVTKFVARAPELDMTGVNEVSVAAQNLDWSGPNQVRAAVTAPFNWLHPGPLEIPGHRFFLSTTHGHLCNEARALRKRGTLS